VGFDCAQPPIIPVLRVVETRHAATTTITELIALPNFQGFLEKSVEKLGRPIAMVKRIVCKFNFVQTFTLSSAMLNQVAPQKTKSPDSAVPCNDLRPVIGKLLTSFQRDLLEQAIAKELRPEYQTRIEIMLLADAGHSQSQICQALGCSYATARYWITIARNGQAHQWQEQPVGRPTTADYLYLERLKQLVNSSPREHGYPFKQWTGQWLSQHLANEFSVKLSDRHINRLLKQMGLSTRSTNTKPQKDSSTLPPRRSNIAIADLTKISAPPTASWSFNL